MDTSPEHYSDMFPPKHGRSAEASKEEKVPLNLRIPKSVKEYLKDARSGGYTETAVILQSIELGRDVSETMGASWWEVVTLSVAEKQAYGVTLGQLALEALKARAAKKK